MTDTEQQNAYALQYCREWLAETGTAEQIRQGFHNACLRVAEGVISSFELQGIAFANIPARDKSTVLVPIKSSDFAMYVSDIWMRNLKDKGQLDFLTMTTLLSEASAAAEACIEAPNLVNYERFKRLSEGASNAIEQSNKAGFDTLAKRKKTKADKSKAGKASGNARGEKTQQEVMTAYRAQLNTSHATHEIAGIVANRLGYSPTHVRRIIKENMNKAG